MFELNLPARVYTEEGNRIEAAFLEACEWLKSLGVFAASNRYSKYLKSLQDFAQDEPDELVSDEGFRQYIVALSEAAELIRIRTSMLKVDSSAFLSRLKKVTSGKAFKSEVGPDPARDFAFELSTASRFLSAGYEVDVTGTADLLVHAGKQKIYVECKRVQSPTKVMKRIGDARKQLRNRLSADPSSQSRGLVACKLTDVLNGEARIVVLPYASDFRRASEAALQGYVRKHEVPLLQSIEKKQLGIFFENNLHGVVYDQKDETSVPAFMNCRGATFFRGRLGAVDMELVTSMAPKLSNQGVL